jgi:hypothetical protein
MKKRATLLQQCHKAPELRILTGVWHRFSPALSGQQTPTPVP